MIDALHLWYLNTMYMTLLHVCTYFKKYSQFYLIFCFTMYLFILQFAGRILVNRCQPVCRQHVDNTQKLKPICMKIEGIDGIY